MKPPREFSAVVTDLIDALGKGEIGMPDLKRDQAKMQLTVHLNIDLLGPFLQHIRDFEAKHFDDIILSMGIDARNMGHDRLLEMMKNIKPPYATVFDAKIEE